MILDITAGAECDDSTLADGYATKNGSAKLTCRKSRRAMADTRSNFYQLVKSLAVTEGRLIPLAPALPTCGDERAIGARLRPATDKMLIAPDKPYGSISVSTSYPQTHE